MGKKSEKKSRASALSAFGWAVKRRMLEQYRREAIRQHTTLAIACALLGDSLGRGRALASAEKLRRTGALEEQIMAYAFAIYDIRSGWSVNRIAVEIHRNWPKLAAEYPDDRVLATRPSIVSIRKRYIPPIQVLQRYKRSGLP